MDTNSLICLFQLLAELKKSNFTLLNERVQFNDNGDPLFGSYALLFWNQTGGTEIFGTCGFYPSLQFFINDSKIQWHSKEVRRVFLCLDVPVCVKYYLIRKTRPLEKEWCQLMVGSTGIFTSTTLILFSPFSFQVIVLHRCLFPSAPRNVKRDMQKHKRESTNAVSRVKSVQVGLMSTQQVSYCLLEDLEMSTCCAFICLWNLPEGSFA